ncbi:Adenosine monophosphate-protein transferase SoFic [Azoarcus sp. Aa7]|nr:Adenosine monophosphate-protein transferase SoFic [Azoarcus sp. Aa7]
MLRFGSHFFHPPARMPPRWIWQHPDWPRFTWQAGALAPLLRQVTLAQGVLLGRTHGSEPELRAEFTLDALLQNIVDSSAIEGETLNVGSVRSSIARRLGLPEGDVPTEPRSEGLAQIMWDATANLDAPLTEARLLQWHTWLFTGDDGFLGRRIHIGDWRGAEPMQVVSGRIDRPTVHFEAPPREGLEARVADFIAWFNASGSDGALDPLLRAALAHFWFVTVHPFDDGNGRITRALTDLALAQGEQQSIRFYAMSVAILADRKGYYAQLETAQKMTASAVPLDLTALAALVPAHPAARHRDGVRANRPATRQEPLLAGAPYPRTQPGTDQGTQPSARWRSARPGRFRTWHQRRAVPSRCKSFEGHGDAPLGRPGGQGLSGKTSRRGPFHPLPDSLARPGQSPS